MSTTWCIYLFYNIFLPNIYIHTHSNNTSFLGGSKAKLDETKKETRYTILAFAKLTVMTL